MKKIIIAGGNSFIGRHVVEQLAEKNDMTVFVRFVTEELKKWGERLGIKMVGLELDDYNKMGDYVSDCDLYLPFTWEGTKKGDRDDLGKNKKSYEKILESVKILVEEKGCKKIIYPGSIQEYGEQKTFFTEESKCEPQSWYGKYKYLLGREIQEKCEAKKINFVELRIFSVYGCDDSDDKFLNQIIDHLLAKETIECTRCEQKWDFLHVKDLANAIKKITEKDIESGIYNIASSEQKVLKEYMEIVRKKIDPDGRIEYGKIPYKDGVIPHVDYNAQKLQRELGWRSTISFEAGVEEIIEERQKR